VASRFARIVPLSQPKCRYVLARYFHEFRQYVPVHTIVTGACATAGGPFHKGYNVLKGIDRYIPVDVYIPGCPPTPEALLEGLQKLQERINAKALGQAMREKRAEYPVPAYGPRGLAPRYNPDIWQPPTEHPFDYQRAPAPSTPS